MKIKSLSTLILFFYLSCSSSLKFGNPEKIPVENSEKVNSLIEEGIALHDQAKYNEAIDKYSEALNYNNENPLALYEISYSYFALGRHNESLKYALKASEYNSDLLTPIYLQIGSNYDLLGKPKDAIKIYDKALERSPDDYLLYYNKGITYSGMKEKENAIDCFKKAVYFNPNHSSSHLALAEQYMNDNYRIPGLLAYLRFLILEPNTQRAGNTLIKLQGILNMGINKESEKNINIVLPKSTPDYDGDFSAVNLTLSLISAARYTEGNKDKQPIELIHDELNSVFEIMSELSEKNEVSGFAWEYYAPYFIEMCNHDFVESFVYIIFQLADDDKIQSWIKNNQELIDNLLEWSNNYQFRSAL